MTVTVLVVDDDPDICTVLSDFLLRAGYRVLLAHDGAAGVALARHERPDVILMDLMLPVMSGEQAIQELRAGEHGDQWCIVAMSAGANLRAISHVEVLDGIISKPFDLEAVVAEMELCLRCSARQAADGK